MEPQKIQWYRLSELPTLRKNKGQEGTGQELVQSANKYYMVAPFLGPLKKWIAQQRKHDVMKGSYAQDITPTAVAEGTHNEIADAPSTHPTAPAPISAEEVKLSDLPELSNPELAAADVSAQLKRMLNISPMLRSDERQATPISAGTLPDSNVLLNLLRNGASSAIPKPTSGPSLPSGHFEQANQILQPPQSQRQSNSQPAHFAAPPPSHSQSPLAQGYPSHLSQPHLPQNHVQSMTSPHFAHGSQTRVPPLQSQNNDLSSIPAHGYPRDSITNFQGIRAPAQDRNGFHATAQLPQGSHIPQAPHFPRQAPAPYQRTGDPDFARTLPTSAAQKPSIPPASKLPLPELNSQSLALLNVFKSGKNAQENSQASQQHPGPTVRPAEAVSSSRGNLHNALPKAGHQRQSIPSNLFRLSDTGMDPAMPRGIASPTRAAGDRIANGLADSVLRRDSFAQYSKPSTDSHLRKPTSEIPQPLRMDRSNTQQQSALLNLFRRESAPADQPMQKTTAPEPVELAANMNHTPKQESFNKFAAEASHEVERPSAKRHRDNTSSAPTSATVTGPLKEPHFPTTAKASNVRRKPNTKEIKSRVNTIPSASSPTSILQRPSTAGKTFPSPTTAPGKAAAPTSSEPPKRFQPQILRRPAPLQSSSDTGKQGLSSGPINLPNPTGPSPDLPSSVRRDAIRAGNHETQAQTLLSLFTKPQQSPKERMASPQSNPQEAIMSPLSYRSSESKPEVDTRIGAGPPRSRLGSVTSAFNGTIARAGSGSQTPTNPLNKSFLLGYLEGVARGDK